MVTRVGPAEEGGNLAVAMDLWQEHTPPSRGDPLGTWRPLNVMTMLSLRTRVFIPGEILCWTPAGNRAPVEQDGTPHFASCPQASSWRRR